MAVQLWYQLPGWTNSANIDMIAVYMTGLATILLLAVPFIPGLRDIPRLIPVHRLIWRRWYRSEPGPAVGGGRTQASRQDPCGPLAVTGDARHFALTT